MRRHHSLQPSSISPKLEDTDKRESLPSGRFRKSCGCMAILLFISVQSLSAQSSFELDILPEAHRTVTDSLTTDTTLHRDTFIAKAKKLLGTIKDKMWEVDEHYCQPRQYRGQIKAMDRIMYEELTMKASDGTDVKMHSHVANYIGPGFIFSPLGVSVKWDVSPQKYDDEGLNIDRQKMEMGVNFYSQLLYADLFYRKTGGDFSISQYNIPGIADILADGGEELDGMGLTKIDWIGGDLNLVLNHRRFSMPAAYMGNGWQIRSAGSPIIGIGYSHRRITNNVANLNSLIGFMLLTAAEEEGTLTDQDVEEYWKSIACNMPSRLIFNDWHLSLGYSYNWALSPSWLINGTLTLQPAIKASHLSNTDVLLADILSSGITDPTFSQQERQESAEFYRELVFDTHKTFIDINATARLSAVWMKQHWKAGANLIVNSSRFHVSPVHVTSTLWSANLYIGYSFWNRKNRKR